MNKKLGMTARYVVFAGALLVGCNSPDAAKQKLTREAKSSSQMPSWEATKQSEERMPDISAETYLAAGRLHETQGRLTRAAAQYRMAVQIKPDNVEAHNRLGTVLCQMRQFKEAETEFAGAIKLAPDQAHLYNNLGFSYLVQARWAEAEGQFRKAVQIKPVFARAHVNLAMVLAQQDKYDEAMRHFQTVVPLEDAWFNIGLMYQSRSRPADAVKAFKTALKLNPNLVAAQQCLDKLPPDVVGQTEPFADVTALAAGPAPSQQAPQAAEPVQAIVSTSQPSDSGQTMPPPLANQDLRTAEAQESLVIEPAQPTSGSPEMAEAPVQAEPSTTYEPSVAEATEEQATARAIDQTPTASQGQHQEPGDPQTLDAGFLSALMAAQPSEGPALVPDSLAFSPSTQPEGEATQWPNKPNVDTESRSLFALQRSPIDLSTGPLAEQEEIVLGAKPPMPPHARKVVLQSTQPATDTPTPEELRMVIEALLEMSQMESSPTMPKPYGQPTSRPATAAPQSRPSAAATTMPSQISMSVEVGMEASGTQGPRPFDDDLDEIFAPAEAFGPADSGD